MIKYFDIGKIVNVHGLKGEIKIYPYANDVIIFNSLSYLIIDNKEIKISNVRIHKNMVLAQLEGVSTRDKAEELIGKIVYIYRKDGHQLSENEYYLSDLYGCMVYENNNSLGKIVDIIHTGSNDVYVVKNNSTEILIPAIKSVIRNIDIVKKRIEVKLLEGLIDEK